MRIESDGHSRGNPRLYELIEHAPKTGKSPTVWAWPELVDYLKIAGQPVAGPWPPHQEPRPDPDYESLPVAVPDPESSPRPAGGPPAAAGQAEVAEHAERGATEDSLLQPPQQRPESSPPDQR
ncbi:MAG: hypothetical protein WB800_42235 [Streptosporangiaceae bacterium]